MLYVYSSAVALLAQKIKKEKRRPYLHYAPLLQIVLLALCVSVAISNDSHASMFVSSRDDHTPIHMYHTRNNGRV